MSQYTFFCVPPTPNGDLHLGHLSGPYLGADVLARYLRAKGNSVTVATGLDDYQSYVFRKAEEQKCSTNEIIATNTRNIRASWRNALIEPDIIVQTSQDEQYKSFVQDLFGKLVANGSIDTQEVRHLFSAKYGYSYQGFVKGICPWCANHSDGNICEICSLPNECIDLIQPISVFTNDDLTYRKVARRYFPLRGNVANLVKEWHRTVPCVQALKTYFAEFWSKDIARVSVSHEADWGLQFSVGSAERIDVWFEMALGFLYYGHLALGDWREAWNGNNRTGFFFGFDNSFYTTVLFPMVFKALEPSLALPTYLHVNQFLNLDGQKFSTSRGHAIWGSDFFSSADPNWGRLYLGSVRSENVRTNFSLEEYRRYESSMKEKWHQAVTRINAGISQFCSNNREAIQAADYARHLPPKLIDSISNLVNTIEYYMEPQNYLLSRASQTVNELLEQVLSHCCHIDTYNVNNLTGCSGLIIAVSEFIKPWMPTLASTVRMPELDGVDSGLPILPRAAMRSVNPILV